MSLTGDLFIRLFYKYCIEDLFIHYLWFNQIVLDILVTYFYSCIKIIYSD